MGTPGSDTSGRYLERAAARRRSRTRPLRHIALLLGGVSFLAVLLAPGLIPGAAAAPREPAAAFAPSGNTPSTAPTTTGDLDERSAASALIWESPDEVRPASVGGTIRPPETRFVVGSIIQTLHALRTPLTLLGGAAILSLMRGGAIDLSPLLRGGTRLSSQRARLHLAIVMAHHGERVPAHAEPGSDRTIHRFVATAKGVTGTGRIHTVDDVDWVEVDTPVGRGWVKDLHLTERIDAETFAEDPAPYAVLEQFVDGLRDRGDLNPFVSRHGLWVSHHDDPIHYRPDEIEDLAGSSRSLVWRGRNPAYSDVTGTFADVVAAGIITAWDRPDRVVEVDKTSVPSTVIPVEYTNFRVLSIGARLTGRDRLDQTAWLAHFSYEGNHPYLIALTREG